MKKIIKIKLLLMSISLLCICSQCEHFPLVDYDYPLYLNNQSRYPVSCYLNDNTLYKAVYPDTAISKFSDRITWEILAREKKA